MQKLSERQKVVSRLRIGLLNHAEAMTELVKKLNFKDTLELHELLCIFTQRDTPKTFLLDMEEVEYELETEFQRQQKEGVINAMQN